MRLLLLVALVGCYHDPASNPSCTILCTDACPDGMACVQGFCVGESDQCDPTFASVRAGNGFACALDTNERLWCWGANDRHQIDGSDQTQIVYATLIGTEHWDAIAAGGDHMCGLRAGALYCWGGNDRQQVSGAVTGDVTTPQRIDSPTGLPWSNVATGYNSTCAIAERLYCWGAGERGQLGIGGITDTGVPTPVMLELTDWQSVSLGRLHACAISASAGLHCWGYNYYGQLGDGGTLASSTPLLPFKVSLPGATSVAVSGSATCAVADGLLYCWGRETNNGTGDPALAIACSGPRNLPTLASTLDGWTRVQSAQSMTCGMRSDEVWCWGRALAGGGLGQGVWSTGTGWGRVTQGATDMSLGWNANVDDLGGDAGDLDLACIIVNGEVQCWGDNRFGQLAQGAATMSPEPREVSGGHRWSTIVAGDAHTCGVANGQLLCWGSTLDGQTNGIVSGTNAVPCGSSPDLACNLGVPTSVPFQPTASALSLGDTHTCALDGETVTCWGTNEYGQLGTTTGSMSPFVVPGAWSKLYNPNSAGNCAVQNGQTWCWGSIASVSQPPTPDARFDGSTLISVTAVIGDTRTAAGCMLDASQNLWCFGANTIGQFGNGPPTPPTCGNTICEIGETVVSCTVDCPAICGLDSCGRQSCPHATCGDGRCTYAYGETCSNCEADCGACPFTQLNRTYTTMLLSPQSSRTFGCGIRPDQQIECWGRNANGQVAFFDSTTGAAPAYVYTPRVVDGLAACSAITASETAACAVCSGDIYCWGSHLRGTVGSGPITAVAITTPRKVSIALDAGESWAQLASGAAFTCARSDRGRAFCWGFSASGALGTGATSANRPINIELAPSVR